MKKFGALLCLAAFAANVLAPLTASAGEWKTVEPKWHLSSVGSPTSGTAIYQRDTTYNVVAGNAADTTGAFSLDDADVWGQHNGGTGLNDFADTLVVGFLVIQSDSVPATASTLTTLTAEIDGRAGGFGSTVVNSQWTQVDSVVCVQVADAAAGGVLTIPILAKSGVFAGTPGGSVANQYYRLMAYSTLRVRITTATGIMPQARVFWRYWDED